MAAGLVTDYLRKLIAKQAEDRNLVVWYDPDRVFSEAAAALSFPKTTDQFTGPRPPRRSP